jgi:tRNA pseudouridine38-40 synthase
LAQLTFAPVSDKNRYFIELAFDGTRYHGWQIQQNAISVQEVLNQALSTLLRIAVETTGCGRTDSGVHARQLFVHFDVETTGNYILSAVFMKSLNSLLPTDISAKRIMAVGADAHARFDATSRSYQYHIHFQKDPFRQGFSWYIRDVPDIGLMNEAALIMMEYRDFSCFSRSHTQVKTNNCVITEARWDWIDDGLVFNISADRFLRNMVRAIVGTLLMVGRKEIKPESLREIIESKNRSNAGSSVPACGLFLTEVKYPYIN